MDAPDERRWERRSDRESDVIFLQIFAIRQQFFVIPRDS